MITACYIRSPNQNQAVSIRYTPLVRCVSCVWRNLESEDLWILGRYFFLYKSGSLLPKTKLKNRNIEAQSAPHAFNHEWSV